MKVGAILLVAVLFTSCFFLTYQISVKAQSSNIVNIPLTFHNYSLLLSDSNGSFCVFDGADGAAATSTNAKQVNLVSQISGTQSGFSYWSASVLWTIKLTSDLHVMGTVNVRAYISSTFALSGFFSGGGYGFGLVDIDENNNEVQEFITQGPISIGSNPFSASPAQYSLNTNVDYVFKKGHSIGFAVGLGATTQGFTATVYFDSIDMNSGATLPVEDKSHSYSFPVNYNDATHNVAVESNSAIADWQFNSALLGINFTAQKIYYTTGYCNVSIPKTLMQKPFVVNQGSHTISSMLTENLTYYQVYFTNTRSSVPIQITGTPISSQPTASPTSASPTSAPSSMPSSSNSPNSTPTTTTGPPSSPSPTPLIPEFSLVIIALIVVVASIAGISVYMRRRVNPK
jgi:hypothetical protein